VYKYSEEQEKKIRQDREELKRLRTNRRIIRSAARGGPLTIPGEVLERAKEEARRCDEYIAGLSGAERAVFSSHYGGGVSLDIVADNLGKSRSSCDDLIKRQLARLSLDGQSGEQSTRRTHRPRPQRRRKGE
jgi:DNA-directed RNA polymerase specialized sigma24 family protein